MEKLVNTTNKKKKTKKEQITKSVKEFLVKAKKNNDFVTISNIEYIVDDKIYKMGIYNFVSNNYLNYNDKIVLDELKNHTTKTTYKEYCESKGIKLNKLNTNIKSNSSIYVFKSEQLN